MIIFFLIIVLAVAIAVQAYFNPMIQQYFQTMQENPETVLGGVIPYYKNTDGVYVFMVTESVLPQWKEQIRRGAKDFNTEIIFEEQPEIVMVLK